MSLLPKKILELGRVEDFEIRNNSIVLLLVGPMLFAFSYFVNNYGNETVRIKGAREIFAFLFFVVGVLPFFLKKTIYRYYGWLIFFLMFSFTHYLIINLYINNFNIRFLLGAYSFVFGAVLFFNNRLFINFFMTTIFIHLVQKLLISNVESILFNSIISSFSLLFLFSYVILNGSTRYRKRIYYLNKNLEKIVEERTFDIVKQTKDLEEKNKDLEEFAYVVSHDLKTPLSNILALSSWLKSDLEAYENDATKENFNLLEKQILQMDLLIRGVLDYSLQNDVSTNSTLVDLDELVNDLAQLNANEKCVISIKKTLPTIEINKTQILQVFQNLIQNAIKYNDKSICYIDIDYKIENDFYIFSIKDNGIGIDEKYHSKIFKLFQKLEVNPEVESIGIGLAIVKKIINLNKGEIYLTSIYKKETTFYFKLPIN